MKQLTSTAIVLCLSLGSFHCFGAHNVGAPAAKWSLEDIQRILLHSPGPDAWCLEYRVLADANRSKDATAYLHREVASRRNGDFSSWNAHGSSTLNWKDDPYQQKLFVSDGQSIIVNCLCHDFSSQEWSVTAPLPGSASSELAFIATGYWNAHQRPGPGRFFSIPISRAEIGTASGYRLKPDLELVNERWCHILECENTDRLSLDMSIGGAIVAREFLDASTGSVRQRIEMTNFNQIEKDVWFPFQWRNIQYRPKRPGKEAEIASDASVQVISIKTNKAVNESSFKFSPAPGSVRVFADGHFAQVGTDRDYQIVDGIAAWLVTRINAPREQPSLSFLGTRPLQRAIDLLLVGVLITLAFVNRIIASKASKALSLKKVAS